MANLANVVTLIAPPDQDVKDGDVVVVKSILGIAAHEAPKGEPVDCHLVGMFDIKKPPEETWEQGDLIYWHITDKKATKDAGGSGKMKIGAAISSVISPGEDEIKAWQVRLNGAF